MNSQPLDTRKLEAWLRQLEQSLQDISVVDRSDIVMELNTHIRESYESGDRSLDDILRSLGEPVQVANRYRLERGVQPVVLPKNRTPIGTFFKWATIGVVSIFLIATIGTVFLASKFFPLVKVDGKNQSVRFLGGAIDIADDEGVNLHIKTGDESTTNFEGEITEKITTVKFAATNGKLEIKTHKEASVEYECKLSTNKAIEAAKLVKSSEDGKVELDFTSIKDYTRCEISIPEKIPVAAVISNGDVRLEKMRAPIDVKVTNGHIKFEAEDETQYTLKTNVTNGLVTGLEEFKDVQTKLGRDARAKEAFSANLTVTNGGIQIF